MNQASQNLIHTWNLGLQVPSIFLRKGHNFSDHFYILSLRNPEASGVLSIT